MPKRFHTLEIPSEKRYQSHLHRDFVLNGISVIENRGKSFPLKPDTTEPRGATGRSERALWDRWILSAQVSFETGTQDIVM